MEITVFINTASLVARAAITGVQLPPASCALLSQLQLRCCFFATGDMETAELQADDLRFVLKSAPTGAALVFSSTFAFADGFHTCDIPSVDSAALRTLIGDQASIAITGEIQWTISGRRERVRFPVTINNALHRPDDVAPDPVAEASLTWLTAQLATRITDGGYFEIQNSDGDWFYLPLNSGRAPD